MPGSTSAAAGPAARVDAIDQEAGLRRARRNATGLLVLVALAFLASTQLPVTTATGFLVAALEAGLVGGLADWFAVVALFRHPLGIPIPHTAVIPRSKEGLGRNLATFVEENFLTGPQVRDRLAAPENVDRLAAWLADPATADVIVARAAQVLDAALDAVDDDELVRRAALLAHQRLGEVELARLAGESLEDAVAAGRHDALLTAALEGLVEVLLRNRDVLRHRLGEQSPPWVPPVVDDLVFERGEQVVRTFLVQVAADPDHELRRTLDEQLLAVTRRMRSDPALQARVRDTVADVVTPAVLEGWIGRWWEELRTTIAAAGDTDDPRGAARRAAAATAVADLGTRLATDDELRAQTVEWLDRVSGRLAEVGQREVGSLIAATVDRWDAQDTSHRLELWLGRDLQFVRINGTVVGALVGVLLHALQSVL